MLFLQSMKADVEDYCDLETVSDEHTFVTKTGAMITIIEYKGIKSLISGDAFSRQIGLMTSNMRNYFKDRGHTIHLAFKVDHETPYAIHDLNAMQRRPRRVVRWI